MQMNRKLTLSAASALALLLVLGTRELMREQPRAGAPVAQPTNERDALAVVEEPSLEPAPSPISEQRIALADPEPPAEQEPAPPSEDSAPQSFSLRVTLRELDGAPLAPGGAHVALTDAVGESFGAHTSVDGVAVLTGLEPGRWWIRGSAPGRRSESRELHLPHSDAGLELELRLAPRPHVRILVHAPDGRPFSATLLTGRRLPSATASQRRPEGWLGDALDSTEWLDCGSFRPGAPDEPEPALLGRIELDCEPPLWVSLHLNEDVLESQLLTPGVEELRFVVDPDTYAARFAELVLRVIDADGGRPMQGVMGKLDTGPRHGLIAISKSESGLRYDGLMAGRARLELSALGYETRVLELTVQPGERKELGDVELKRKGAGTLEVHVSSDAAASDLQVTWAAEEGLRDMDPGASMKYTAPYTPRIEGEALEIELGRGRWVLWASARREGVELRSRLQLVEMAGGRVVVTLVLEPVARLVLEPVGRPIDVWVQTPEGLLAHSAMLRVDEAPRHFELVPGSYLLRLRERGGEERVQQVDLPALGATIRLE